MAKRMILVDETNAEALEKLTTYNFDAMAVVDYEHRLLGIVEREELVSKLVLALTRRGPRDST